MDGDGATAAEIKGCCAAVYGSGLVHLLLGGRLHPGGGSLTSPASAPGTGSWTSPAVSARPPVCSRPSAGPSSEASSSRRSS